MNNKVKITNVLTFYYIKNLKFNLGNLNIYRLLHKFYNLHLESYEFLIFLLTDTLVENPNVFHLYLPQNITIIKICINHTVINRYNINKTIILDLTTIKFKEQKFLLQLKKTSYYKSKF